MKKIVILLCVLFLSGCTAKYELTIDKTLHEKITLYEKQENIPKNPTKKQIDALADTLNDFEDGYQFYQKTFLNHKKTGYIYQTDFTYLEYDALSIIRKCYETIELKEGTKNELKTSDEFLCFQFYPALDTIEIEITLPFQVIEENADSKSGNTYIWTLKKNQGNQNPIHIKWDPNQKKETIEGSINTNKNILYLITILILLIIVIVLIIKYKKKQ